MPHHGEVKSHIQEIVEGGIILVSLLIPTLFISLNPFSGGPEVYMNFLYLFFLCIVLGAFFYGKIGGVLVALVSSIVCGAMALIYSYPLSAETQRYSPISTLLEQLFFQIISYNFIGIVAGELAERLRQQKDFYQQMAIENKALHLFNENILDSLNTGVITIDKNGDITSYNKYMEEKMGLTSEDLGTSYTELNLCAAIPGALPQVFSKGVPFLLPNYEIGLDSSDGDGEDEDNSRVIDIKIYPLYQNQMIVGATIIYDDVTEKYKIEEQLARAEKLALIGQMSAGMVHDINNPLSSISGMAQLIQSNPGDAEKSARRAGIIIDLVRYVSAISRSLLGLAQPSKGPVLGQCDVNEVVGQVVEMIGVQIDKKNLEVHTHLAPNLPMLAVNRSEIEQILINLIFNSTQAMVNNGRIDIKTKVVNRESTESVISTPGAEDVEIIVEDTGPGIEPQILEKVFEPFFTTKGRGGSGLGLYVSRKIIENNDGTINVSSVPGEGTTVRVRIPVTEIAAPVKAKAVSS